MTDQYSQLEEAARKATPEHWSYSSYFDTWNGGRLHGFVQCGPELVPVAAIPLSVEGFDDGRGRARAAFIALANPARVLALIAENRALIERVRELEGAGAAMLAANDRVVSMMQAADEGEALEMTGELTKAVKLTEAQRDVLQDLNYANHMSPYPTTWATPLDIGASNGSHHSGALAALSKKGLVQFKQRGAENPPEGENGVKRWRGRGSKCYRITPAGRALLDGDGNG